MHASRRNDADVSGQKHPDFSSPIGTIIFAAVLGFFAIGLLSNPAEKQAREDALAQLTAKNEAIIEEVATKALEVIIPNGFTPRPGEKCFLQQAAREFTVQTITRGRGHRVGVSVPVGHGIRISTGTFASAPLSSTGFAPAGSGTLYLTSERIVFIGTLGAKSVPRNRILNVEDFKDGFRLDVDGATPAIFITGDFRFNATYRKMLGEEAREQTNPAKTS